MSWPKVSDLLIGPFASWISLKISPWPYWCVSRQLAVYSLESHVTAQLPISCVTAADHVEAQSAFSSAKHLDNLIATSPPRGTCGVLMIFNDRKGHVTMFLFWSAPLMYEQFFLGKQIASTNFNCKSHWLDEREIHADFGIFWVFSYGRWQTKACHWRIFLDFFFRQPTCKCLLQRHFRLLFFQFHNEIHKYLQTVDWYFIRRKIIRHLKLP